MSTQSSSGPYRPTTWSLGGTPKKDVDIPVTAVFLVLYIIGGATHMTIFQYNKRRGHNFLFNGMLFGFCTSRVTTCILRIASISLPTNIRLAIAAQIFVAAGILLVFIINLIWAQRILRAHHPFGWQASTRWFFKALYAIVVFTLAIVITSVVQSFYTLRPRTKTIDRALQLYGVTLFAVVSFLPIPLIALSGASKREVDKFGQGRHRTKVAVLLTGAALCCLGAAYRAGTSWMTPVPLSQPEPARFHKGWFYFMDFGIEVLVVYMYAIMRVDLRFHVPDGAEGPGSYRVGGGSEGDVESLGTREGSGGEEEEKKKEDSEGV
ncbi:hypothetical protein P171DRAFT_425870 [Karstenula rhodostoma CBS 690.94]|uniref:Family c-likeg-protein-coupled receptor protein n=1 Tax=Karstenula rhodostoma CBS 690.94 TaxID=1392251 RepID=A0A9P4PY00_9PLEO|nr:hypothetical protein P171DRAFT_425870 [Karstenula rhodostoma CBS 690.94]